MGTMKYHNFGRVRKISDDVSETRTLSFIISSSSRDRHGTVLNQNNWQLDNYRRNPIVSYMHNLFGDLFNPPDPNDIIARTTQLWRDYLEDGSQALFASAEFEPAELNPKADTIFKKIIFGSMGATSVGFQEVGKGRYGTGDEARGEKNETYYFEGQELLEWSIVNIPSNPDTGKRSLRTYATSNQDMVSYAQKELGKFFRASRLEEMTIDEIIALLKAKSLGIKSSDPARAIKQMKAIETVDRLKRLHL